MKYLLSIELMIVNPMTKKFTGKEVYSHVEYMRLINSFHAKFLSN
jgi:hypothetical protein